MSKDAFEIAEEISTKLDAATISSPDELEKFRIQFLGSKNEIKALFGEIRMVANERKKEFGQTVNALKAKAEKVFSDAQTALQGAGSEAANGDLDLSRPAVPNPKGSIHPVTIVLNKVISIFERIGFTVAEEREIEDDWHNFTAMNTPDDHPARDMQDTFYLKNSIDQLLRTHTSSVQARVMTSQQPPIRIIAPGRVYRNETISARSHCQFHQVEGLFIDKNVSFADMKQTLMYFAKEMYGPETDIRLRPSYFPFTEPSAEMDVWMGTATEEAYRLTKGTGWLEVLGCGMVDPKVLSNCNIDPEVYTGFAFGIGIERTALQKYGINDIRMLFENDLRFLKQFNSAM